MRYGYGVIDERKKVDLSRGGLFVSEENCIWFKKSDIDGKIGR